MTTNEAIDIMTKLADKVTWASYHVGALRMAIEALKKQVPKKISFENGFVKCNTCEKYIRLPIADKYSCCPECGQAIDWSGLNE